MSNPNVGPAHWKPASATDLKVSQIDANLRLATENAQAICLRRLLQELCHTQPDAHRVTGALLLATQQKYTEKIKANKSTQSDEEEEEEEEEEDADGDDKDESESDESSDVGEISELTSEEEEADEESDDDSDDDTKRKKRTTERMKKGLLPRFQLGTCLSKVNCGERTKGPLEKMGIAYARLVE